MAEKDRIDAVCKVLFDPEWSEELSFQPYGCKFGLTVEERDARRKKVQQALIAGNFVI